MVGTFGGGGGKLTRDSAASSVTVASTAAADAQQRLLATHGSISLPLPVAGYMLRYAYVSQRGYYPDSPDKPNQDTVCVVEQLGGSAGAWHHWQVLPG